MDEDEARLYRRAVEDLTVAQSVDLPACPFDGEPCSMPEMDCQVVAFGTFAVDGNEEVLWSCPRLKERRLFECFLFRCVASASYGTWVGGATSSAMSSS